MNENKPYKKIVQVKLTREQLVTYAKELSVKLQTAQVKKDELKGYSDMIKGQIKNLEEECRRLAIIVEIERASEERAVIDEFDFANRKVAICDFASGEIYETRLMTESEIRKHGTRDLFVKPSPIRAVPDPEPEIEEIKVA